MKRSARVALTLLVPAMTAFGCNQRPVYPPMTASPCDVPTVPGSLNQPPSCAAPTPMTGYRSSSYYSGSGYRSNRPGSWASSGTNHSSSHTSWGGFGGTSSHFSGGS